MPDTPSARGPTAGLSATTSRLRWIFVSLVTLSVLSVLVVSSRMGLTTQHLQKEATTTLKTPQDRKPTEETTAANSTQNDDLRTSLAAPALTDPAATETSAVAHDMAIIPRIIHQSWKDIDRIPTRFQPWMQSWRKLHPTWTYVFWTDEDNLRLFEQLYPRYLHVARAVTKVSLADMARYALLHRVGGLYVDADFECLQPFDRLHQQHKLFLSSEPLVHTVLLEKSNSAALCNALMASAPGHPFWLRVLENIKDKFDRERLRSDAVALTGPRIVKATYLADQSAFDESGMTVLSSEYFYPEVAYWNIGSMEAACKRRKDTAAKEACAWLRKFPEGEFTANTFASHHWQCTWCRDAHLDEYAPLDAIFESPPKRPNITSTGIHMK